MPTWQADGKLKFHYWFKANPGPLITTRSEKLADWEKVITQLVARKEFTDENGFCTIQGIYALGSQTIIQSCVGRYEFEPGREYDLRIYHYDPKAGALSAQLTLAT